MKQTDNWSKSWKSSTDPQKQRKYRENAPQHVKDDFISANISHSLRDKLGTRNMGIRNGDRVKVMRGDRKGAEGIVNEIDRENERIFIDGVEKEAVDGSKHQIPLRPSNVQIQSLNLSDSDRLAGYDVEDQEEIKVSDEDVEEALEEEDEEQEMMQQMQGGESGAHEQFEEEDLDEEEVEEIKEEIEEEIDEEELAEEAAEDSEESSETPSSEEEAEEPEPETDEEAVEEIEEAGPADYEDIVSGTISDAKDQISELESPDFDELIEAEKANKDRKTMIEYLENQKED
ncbi:MAG: 50S ribosomal protein L24 [Candidatus Nanosalina sp.]